MVFRALDIDVLGDHILREIKECDTSNLDSIPTVHLTIEAPRFLEISRVSKIR